MKTFTDAANRTWTVSLTLGTAMAVKSRLNVDLLAPEAGQPPLLTRLGTDEILLGEVLCALLESQFAAHQVTTEDVCLAFDGRTLLAAQQAFYQEWVDFFQSRGRTDRAKAIATQQALIDAAVAAIETRLAAIDVEATVAGAMSGGLREPSGSIPDR